MTNFIAICKTCDDTRTVLPQGNDVYRCIECGTLMDSEGGVLNMDEYNSYYDSYRGAEKAGLIASITCDKYGHESDGYTCVRCGISLDHFIDHNVDVMLDEERENG